MCLLPSVDPQTDAKTEKKIQMLQDQNAALKKQVQEEQARAKQLKDDVKEAKQAGAGDVSPLQPMYSFGKWWKWKCSLMGFVYRVVRVLKALCIFLSETINFLRNCIKLTFLGCPRKFYHRGMYIAPSSGHISLNFNMLFKLILRRFEVVFSCLEWECCTFWKIDGNYGFNLAIQQRSCRGSVDKTTDSQ